MSIHTLYGVEIAANKLGGITNVNVGLGIETRKEIGDGAVYPSVCPIHAQAPSVGFTTRALDAALGFVGAAGAAITSGANFDAYAQAHAEGGTRAGATSHRQYTINEGIIVPRRLSCDHQGDAELTYDVIATYDGTNAPIIVSDGVSLPSGFTDTERWSLGPCEIESYDVPWLQRLEIDFGIETKLEGAQSEIWPTFVSIVSIKPVITLRGIDPTWLKSTNIPLAGKAVTQANTAIYLRKRAAGASWASGAVHLKLQCAGLAFVDPAMDSDASGPAATTLIVQCLHDGTNAPLVITPDQSLPT